MRCSVLWLLLALCAASPEAQGQTTGNSVAYGPALPEDGIFLVEASVHQSLEVTLTRMLGRELGSPLAQVAKRVVIWWLDPRRDLRAGDALTIAYSRNEDEEPIIHALWLDSQKVGSFEAMLFKAQASPWPRHFDRQGLEIEARLKGTPIESYEQVTSLLGDGRGHKGVDFKAPVGTPILATFDGAVARRNWSTRSNGRCLELIGDDGMRAYYLHLERASVKPGERVRTGDVIGTSGNTGRSTAPHLHYQLMNEAGRVVDPYRYHSTHRRKLPATERPEFERAWARFEDLRSR